MDEETHLLPELSGSITLLNGDDQNAGRLPEVEGSDRGLEERYAGVSSIVATMGTPYSQMTKDRRAAYE